MCHKTKPKLSFDIINSIVYQKYTLKIFYRINFLQKQRY